MELQEFITKVLTEIDQGIKDANKQVKNLVVLELDISSE